MILVARETLTPEQITMMRVAARGRVQEWREFPTGEPRGRVLAIRPLLAADFPEGRARLEAAPLPAQAWQVVAHAMPGPRAIAVMGFVAYAARPQIDVIRLRWPGGLETFSLAEINAAARVVLEPDGDREQFVDLRRIGYIDPALVVPAWDPLEVSVLSHYGTKRESFDLIGLVAEARA